MKKPQKTRGKYRRKKIKKYVLPRGLKHYFKTAFYVIKKKVKNIFVSVSVGVILTFVIYLMLNDTLRFKNFSLKRIRKK